MENLWTFKTDVESNLFIKDILIELISRFPLNQSEGIELINNSWKHIDSILKDDIIFHESPEYWASTFYWGHDSYWWISRSEQIERHLPELKPIRENMDDEYQLWENISNGELKDYIFVSGKEIKELKERNILSTDYIKKWAVNCINYIEALCELHRYKNWIEYRPESNFYFDSKRP